jgi:hypothetical protein
MTQESSTPPIGASALGQDATAAVRTTGDHPIVEKGARLGYVMSGLLHFLIGWIALRVAWDIDLGQDDGDLAGALATVANSQTGPVLMWLAIVGFALLALWQLTEAVARRHGGGIGTRAKSLAKAVVYAVISWSAFRVTREASAVGEEATQSLTAQVMDRPGGRIAVALIGLGVVVVGGYHVWKGGTCRFLGDLDRHPGRTVETLGRIGYVAKGVSLSIVGALFVTAALTARSAEAGGLDAALRTVRDQPFGPYLLTVVAAGITAYGVYAIARARHARL